jgi:hypothetical protein
MLMTQRIVLPLHPKRLQQVANVLMSHMVRQGVVDPAVSLDLAAGEMTVEWEEKP